MQVNLSWNAVTNALFYRLYRGTVTGGPYLLIAQSNPNMSNTPSQAVTTYQDGPGNLVNGQDYFYRVAAVTVDGESAYSAEFAAIWPGASAAPTGLTGVIT